MDVNILEKESFLINPDETEPSVKFPELVGQNKRILLNTEEDTFYAQVKYSYSTGWIVIEIQDTNQNVIQTNSYVADFPNNLIQCDELIGYGLFFLNYTFYFVKLPEDFYRLKLDEETYEKEFQYALLQA